VKIVVLEFVEIDAHGFWLQHLAGPFVVRVEKISMRLVNGPRKRVLVLHDVGAARRKFFDELHVSIQASVSMEFLRVLGVGSLFVLWLLQLCPPALLHIHGSHIHCMCQYP
jgi:hypothetical protein